MDLPLYDYQDDNVLTPARVLTNNNLIEDAPIYEFMDSITGTQCEDGDVINIEAYITEYLLNDDADAMDQFIRTYIAHDYVTPKFQRILPELMWYIWQLAILNNSWNVVIRLMQLSGNIIPMVNTDALTDMTAIYRYFWTTQDTDMIEDAIIPMLKYDDIDILLMNSLYYLSQYSENMKIASMNDADLDIDYRGVFSTSHEIAQIETDIATGQLKGDVGNLDLYENNQMPGDYFIRLNAQRLIDYLDDFIRVIELTYDSPYRSVFDVAAVLVELDQTNSDIFERLRDEDIEFDPEEAHRLLSPEQYGYIEQIGDAYEFDSSRVELGGVLSQLSSYPAL